MNVSCNSSVSGNVHVDVLFQYAMIIVVLLLYIDETKIKIINLGLNCCIDWLKWLGLKAKYLVVNKDCEIQTQQLHVWIQLLFFQLPNHIYSSFKLYWQNKQKTCFLAINKHRFIYYINEANETIFSQQHIRLKNTIIDVYTNVHTPYINTVYLFYTMCALCNLTLYKWRKIDQ